ncbi:MAG: hypothetical protein SGJ21_12450 [Alphaproteobacteria bacterium]|nr:hypothetical protein [Alphaproteobacteria bacterium]
MKTEPFHSGWDAESWKAQLRKGAAELAILGMLAPGERYGIELLG